MHLPKYSFILFLFLLLTSCGKKSEKEVDIPADILTEAQFTQVLTDYALAESAANLNIKNVIIQKSDSVYAFNPLIENNIRKTQYDSAILFYTAHPELYKKIYENVLETLSEMQAKRNGLKADSSSK